MKTYLFCKGSALFLSLLVALFCLAGCADTHWERAFYQGARQGSAQCQLARKPTDPPCAELLGYDHYERERAKARNGPVPSTLQEAAKEQQP
ncbi:MAG: hypothetical protein V4627_06960 [Pseudomonadota bacterium]